MFTVYSSLASAECVDSDGDGYGWDGKKTCIVNAVSNSQKCIDPDGDGWGWANNKSCKVSESQTNSTKLNSEAPNNFNASFRNSSKCVDTDGDGYGWDGQKSCRISRPSQGKCIDSDGDGYGWDGKQSCRVYQEAAWDSDLGSYNNPLPLGSHPRCIDSNNDGKTTIQLQSNGYHYACDSQNQPKCKSRNGDINGLLSVNSKYYRCIVPMKERVYKEPTVAELTKDNLVAICSTEVAESLGSQYYKQLSASGEYLWPCAQRCRSSSPSKYTSWSVQEDSNGKMAACLMGGSEVSTNRLVSVVYKPDRHPDIDRTTKVSRPDIYGKDRTLAGSTNPVSSNRVQAKESYSYAPPATVTSGSTDVADKINAEAEAIQNRIDNSDLGGIAAEIDNLNAVALEELHRLEADPESSTQDRLDAWNAVSESEAVSQELSYNIGELRRKATGMDPAEAAFQTQLTKKMMSQVTGKTSPSTVGKIFTAMTNLVLEIIQSPFKSAVAGPSDNGESQYDPADLNYDGFVEGYESGLHGLWITPESAHYGEFGGPGVPVVTVTTQKPTPTTKPASQIDEQTTTVIDHGDGPTGPKPGENKPRVGPR